MVKPFSLAASVSLILLFSVSLSSASSYTFYIEPTSGAVELEISHPAVSLERIFFSVPDQPGGTTLRVDRIEPSDEWVYDYFRITTTGIQGEPGPVVFDIRVNRSWVSESGSNIDLGTLSFSVFKESDQEWERLPMAAVSEDAEFLNYRAYPTTLTGLFAVTGEPVPVQIEVSSPCNGNDFCEPDLGEDRENCPDCISLRPNVCVPSETYCVDDDLFTCSEDGTDYIIEQCALGCANGACIGSAGAPAGMAVALNPVFISVVAVLLTVVVYLTLLVRKMRGEIMNIEESKASHEDIKKIVRRKD